MPLEATLSNLSGEFKSSTILCDQSVKLFESIKKIFSSSLNTSGSQNPSVLVIKTGVPHAIDCKATLCPDG